MEWNTVGFFSNLIILDFNGMSTHLVLFYAERLENHIQCTFIFYIFEYVNSFVFFLHTILSNTNNS